MCFAKSHRIFEVAADFVNRVVITIDYGHDNYKQSIISNFDLPKILGYQNKIENNSMRDHINICNAQGLD